MNPATFRRKELALAVAYSVIAAGLSAGASAQEANNPVDTPRPTVAGPAIEEIVVTTRLKDSAAELVMERMEQPFSAEILGVDQIVRVGDSDVAAALRRVTGLTLIGGQYVYVRGLGERYSSTTLNGAHVPSPELSRNVIPLDLFPTSILSSVKVHKAYSPDQPAAFGGGNIDIRTRGVPNGPVFNVSFGTGWDSNYSDKGLKTLGDNGDLPGAIAGALAPNQGNLQNAPDNRDLMLSLDRGIDLSEESLDPDMNGSISAGNSWLVNDDWEIGLLANFNQKSQTRNRDQVERDWAFPGIEYEVEARTVKEENQTAALNFGVNYQDKHYLSTNSYLLQNDEDQSSIILSQNNDFVLADGQQRKTYSSRLEKRELMVNQLIGEHRFEDGDFGALHLPDFVQAIDVNWIYSDATASTEVPNAVTVQASNSIDPSTGQVLRTSLNVGTSSQFSFLELEDEMESGGFTVSVPFEFDRVFGTVSGGYLDTTKSREYYGYTANINATSSADRVGLPSEVLGNDRLSDPANGFYLTMGSQFGTESYIAAETVQAYHGTVDLTLDHTWRLTAGFRWEDFKRGGPIPLDLLDYSGESMKRVIEAMQDPNQTYAFQEDDFYPSIAVTYMGHDLLNADDYQIRFGYGKTVVRPDLREVSDVMYLDPELNKRVVGNRNLDVAEVDHIDLRAEFYYGDGSNLTASLFYKDITDPIEQIELAGAQDIDVLSFLNAESGAVYGIELEGLKELGRGFFLTGNVVLSDSEIDFGGDSAQTSRTRRMTGHSEYVVNAQLGYDSADGLHSVSAVYNVFGDRIFSGGRQPNPDTFEEPFHSLDLVYSFYPTEQASVKLKVQNLLGEEREFTQGSVTAIEEEVGTSVGLDFKWSF
ncbi:TonB-dependent receptor domain-containing protein [Gilvimarinus sp. F26214L]|uniref:TonB-dependent receptor domain-containing protein n=1 Tax=Gilvimarinus sp. DZF01 TaxID=3461371 RepID=UPI0040466C81